MTGGRGHSLTSSLRETLGRSIVSGDFAVAGFPTEAALAQLHGVSRSVIREAVKMLSAKGLLSARPRIGTCVEPDDHWNLLDPDVMRWLLDRKFSLTLLRQFSQLRLGIEPAAAALAAINPDRSKLAVIEQGFARMQAAERGEDDALDADVAFHTAILHATGNPFFYQFEQLIDTALRTSIRFTNRFKGRTASLPDHGAVLDAIVRGDSDASHAAMRDLIGDVIQLVEGAKIEAEPDR